MTPMLLASLAIGGAAYGAWRFSERQAIEPAATSGLVSTLPSPSTETPTPLASTLPVVPAPRVVKVGVLPATAYVEVDGQKAEITSGSVDLAGTLGSLHKVRVVAGGREAIIEVAIAEGGPMPPTVGLGAPAPRGVKVPPASTQGAPAQTAGASKASSAASAKPTGVTLDKKFE
jgi:serine/threonine-protein kinase